MRLLAVVTVVFALVLLPIVGCAEVTTPEVETAPLTLTLKSFDPDPSNEVLLEGVEVCDLDMTNCVVTSANGEATLMLPVGQGTGYTVDKEGYAPFIFTTVLSLDGQRRANSIPTDQRIADQHDRLMSPYPMRGTGTIMVDVAFGSAGVTFDLAAATGKAYYLDEERIWRSDLTATTSEGTGGFVEVSPGEYQVNLGGTAQGCAARPGEGVPGDMEGSVRVPVREGYVSYAEVNCPLP